MRTVTTLLATILLFLPISMAWADISSLSQPAFASAEYPLQPSGTEPSTVSTETSKEGKEASVEPTPERPYMQDHARGWWWGEDPPIPTTKKERQAEELTVKKAPKKKPKKLEEMNAAEIRAEVQRLLEVASVNPTEANVKTFLEAQDFAFKKASVFAATWKRIVWQTPSLNPAIKSPSATAGINAKERIDEQKRVATIEELARRYGIFFFFKSDCPYCHVMGPSLKHFSEKYGIEVFPISIDGGGLPDFPTPQMDNGLAERLEITTVPAIFLGDRETSNLTAIGFGVIAETELLDRIYILTQTKPGDN